MRHKLAAARQPPCERRDILAQFYDQTWLPATFRERGVAVPFTTPQLAGARIRLVDRRFDLIVPHPGGARGVYIFALASLGEFCAASLHDRCLAARLAVLGAPTPGAVRTASRTVAAEGAAGRAAAAAARAAETADGHIRAAFETLLLGLPPRNGIASQTELEMAQATRKAIQALASRLGGTPEAVQVDIGRLAGQLTDAGLDSPAGGKGRCATLLDTMDVTADAMRHWTGTVRDHPAALQVAAAARSFSEAGRLLLAATHKTLQDPAALIAAWGGSMEAVSARCARPALLLDGWEHLCLLWRVAETNSARSEAVEEAAVLLPPIPPEAETWFEAQAPLRARLQAGGVASALPRAGRSLPSQVVNLVERNERIRALAA